MMNHSESYDTDINEVKFSERHRLVIALALRFCFRSHFHVWLCSTTDAGDLDISNDFVLDDMFNGNNCSNIMQDMADKLPLEGRYSDSKAPQSQAGGQSPLQAGKGTS